MSFLFKNYSLVKVMYLLIRDVRLGSSCETHTHMHQKLRERLHWKGLVSMKINDTPPSLFFDNNPTYFTNLPIFMKKMETPPFSKISNTRPAPPLFRVVSIML